jgi:hypothetical protein
MMRETEQGVADFYAAAGSKPALPSPDYTYTATMLISVSLRRN